MFNADQVSQQFALILFWQFFSFPISKSDQMKDLSLSIQQYFHYLKDDTKDDHDHNTWNNMFIFTSKSLLGLKKKNNHIIVLKSQYNDDHTC